MINHKISIVIRTFNEDKHLDLVLKSISRQTYKNYEIVIVDSGSTDNTLEIAKKYHTKVVDIDKNKFNYSYASNVGVQNSDGDIVCFLSGHSVPLKNDYLEETNSIFQDSKVGAIYGEITALPDGSLTEKAFNWIGRVKSKMRGDRRGLFFETQIHPGIFSCSNASARITLLEKYPFQEALGRGGEDIEVAFQILNAGYFVVKASDLIVMHSHGKGFFEFLEEYRDWQIMYKEAVAFIASSKNGGINLDK